jgi:hypothetical protein
MALALTSDESSLIDALSGLGARISDQAQTVRESLLRGVTDKSAVRQYLELCIVRRFEEIYRDNLDKRVALKAFALEFLYGYEQDWIASRLNISIEKLVALQQDGLQFLRKDTLLVVLVRDWLSLKT